MYILKHGFKNISPLQTALIRLITESSVFPAYTLPTARKKMALKWESPWINLDTDNRTHSTSGRTASQRKYPTGTKEDNKLPLLSILGINCVPDTILQKDACISFLLQSACKLSAEIQQVTINQNNLTGHFQGRSFFFK